MAGVKDATTAAEITTRSKHARMQRLIKLFGIRNLKDLFPEGATPNGAEYLYLNCSGDVLRDLCQIGEHLKNRRMSAHASKLRVRRAFKAGQMATHQDVKALLKILRDNEVESAMKTHIVKHENEDMDGDMEEPCVRGARTFLEEAKDTELLHAPTTTTTVEDCTAGADADSDDSAPMLISVPQLQVAEPSSRQVRHTPRPIENVPPIKYDALVEKNTRLYSALLFAQHQFKAIEAKIAAGEPILAVDAMIGSQLLEQVLEENKV
jgi:hypothetical protein